MSIHFHEDLGIFHLQSERSSYVIELVRGVYPAHAYCGRRIRDHRIGGLLERRGRASFSLDSLPQEYPGYGSGDFRQPAYQVQLANGTTVTEMETDERRIGHSRDAWRFPELYLEVQTSVS
ncbi:glycoside hydrolase family 36 N-terminal domain-containing protein [Paenibacillus lautus]|uniref:glycoside hydrolase family 36 N-terminal domain-containing protein n=1 Tax=Paenibacillus lautus TaxID=1401 RepID=UPI003D26E4A2